jgi:PPOX class probable F420-dependent enzyme
MTVPIPESHRDLLVSRVPGVLSTLMPNGQPQSSVVRVDYDGMYILINTTLECQQGRNMHANPKVSLLVIDPQHDSRWIEVRGQVVEISRVGAETHADLLTHRYAGKRHFSGDIFPVEQRKRETPVIVKIEPLKVSLDAIFK